MEPKHIWPGLNIQTKRGKLKRTTQIRKKAIFVEEQVIAGNSTEDDPRTGVHDQEFGRGRPRLQQGTTR